MSRVTILKDSSSGEFRVPGPSGTEASAYYTDSKSDAEGTAKRMWNDSNIQINFRTVPDFDRFQNKNFQNGRMKAKNETNNKLANANPDGTISPDEDRKRKDLIQKAKRISEELKREAYNIGGSFRGPGIWVEVKRNLG